jgi:hypothetical protein
VRARRIHHGEQRQSGLDLLEELGMRLPYRYVRVLQNGKLITAGMSVQKLKGADTKTRGLSLLTVVSLGLQQCIEKL